MTQPTNVFCAGDNAEVLGALPEGSVDLCYLDPPYNTGNAFAYSDDVRGSEAAPQGPRQGRHHAWTTVLRPRLQQVHRLLAPTGAVFASIDDHEQAHLRLLLDEVFGEENFLAQVVVGLNPKGRQLGGGFATSHEYLLVYARDARRCVLDPTSADAVDPADFPLTDDGGQRYRRLPLRNTNKKFNPRTAATMHYPLHGDPGSGRVASTAFDGSHEIWPVFGDGSDAVWRWSAARVDQRPSDLVCRTVRGRAGERVDVFQRDWLTDARTKKLSTVWTAAEVGSTDQAVAELKRIVGHVFESPKPTALLRRVLATMPPGARVLDPYAGSGTTGHAVALANAADGGTRRCLSIETDAPVRPGSYAAQAGLARIADVTRTRLQAVADQVGGGYAEVGAQGMACMLTHTPAAPAG